MKSKLLDSAFVLASLSAGLYFLGLLNEEGDASGMGLPRSMLARGLWDTVAYGGEGLLALTVLLPSTIGGSSGIGWRPIAFLVLVVGVGLIAAYLSRKSEHRAITVCLAVYVALCIHVMATSSLQMKKSVELAAALVQPRSCDKEPADRQKPKLMRVVFSMTESEEDERSGIMLAVSEKFLVMESETGLFLLPLDKLKRMEAVTIACRKKT
jgi:hypothetical protein